jgi:hypothetical protein
VALLTKPVNHAADRLAMVFEGNSQRGFTQLAAAGTVARRDSCTRRQSSPSSNAWSWAELSRMTPLSIAGQLNFLFSNRLAISTTPVPTQKISFTRSARFARNTYTTPENGSVRMVSRTSAASPPLLSGSRPASSPPKPGHCQKARSRVRLERANHRLDAPRLRIRPNPNLHPGDRARCHRHALGGAPGAAP